MGELSEYYGERAINGNTLLRLLGFSEIVNIDIVEHTPLTYKHDLGEPLPEDMWDRFALVMDGTTGSHVADSMALLSNGVRLLKVGGRIIHTCGMSLLGGSMPPFNPQLLTRFYQSNGFRGFRNYFCNSVHGNSCYLVAGDPLYPMVLENLQQYSLFFSAVKEERLPLAVNPTEHLYVLEGRKDRLFDFACLAGKKVAIWGTGGHYVEHYRDAVLNRDLGFKVWGFVDNKREHWGKTLDGFTVYSPDDLKESGIDVVLLATWQKWEVFEQLCTLAAAQPGIIAGTYAVYRHVFERGAIKEDYMEAYLARGFMSRAVLAR